MECSTCKNQITQLKLRFIRNEKHQHIKCIVCSCSKKLVAKDLRDLEEDMMIGCSCKLAYKLIKINGKYIDRNSTLMKR
jgi:hypothetical protein